MRRDVCEHTFDGVVVAVDDEDRRARVRHAVVSVGRGVGRGLPGGVLEGVLESVSRYVGRCKC